MLYTISTDTSFTGHFKFCAAWAHRALKKEESAFIKAIMVLVYPVAALCWVRVAYKRSKAGEGVRVPSKK
jgi:hypothetical protein